MADGSLSITIQVPASVVLGSTDPQGIGRTIAKAMLAQAGHDVGDPRVNSGNLTYAVGTGGNQVLGTWTYTPPS